MLRSTPSSGNAEQNSLAIDREVDREHDGPAVDDQAQSTMCALASNPQHSCRDSEGVGKLRI